MDGEVMFIVTMDEDRVDKRSVEGWMNGKVRG